MRDKCAQLAAMSRKNDELRRKVEEGEQRIQALSLEAAAHRRRTAEDTAVRQRLRSSGRPVDMLDLLKSAVLGNSPHRLDSIVFDQLEVFAGNIGERSTNRYRYPAEALADR